MFFFLFFFFLGGPLLGVIFVSGTFEKKGRLRGEGEREGKREKRERERVERKGQKITC